MIFLYQARLSSETLANPKYSCNQDGGTHRRLFPPDHIVDLKEVAMNWVLRLPRSIEDVCNCMVNRLHDLTTSGPLPFPIFFLVLVFF